MKQVVNKSKEEEFEIVLQETATLKRGNLR
jgi:hypothetical protein